MQSVLQQNYPNLEYIVQDGGSTDGTDQILEKYRTKLKSAVSHPDGGQANAINLGFQHASGEIMAWLNSDDLLLPGTVVLCRELFFSASGDGRGLWPPHQYRRKRPRDRALDHAGARR